MCAASRRVVQASYFFFFSSRRRHTRFDCDWSSDVCSSDLVNRAAQATLPPATITPSIDSGLVRAVLDARGGDVVPLHADAHVLGEMIVVPHPNGGALAGRGRGALHRKRRQTDGRPPPAARP